MMRSASLVALTVLVLSISLAAGAEFREYPEFRYISGLPGGGWGITPEGRVGFAGALQQNIPVGYTPRVGNYVIGGHSGAINGGLQLGTGGEDVNGTGGYGIAIGGEHSLWIYNMETSRDLESAYNFQYQLRRETAKQPGIALGIVDAFSVRAANLSDATASNGRSFFAVATKQYEVDGKPLFATVGLGDGRFNDRLFGGVSYELGRELKVCTEYDGWNLNAGAAYDIAGGWKNWHAVLFAGWADLSHATVGVTITRTNSGF